MNYISNFERPKSQSKFLEKSYLVIEKSREIITDQAKISKKIDNSTDTTFLEKSYLVKFPW